VNHRAIPVTDLLMTASAVALALLVVLAPFQAQARPLSIELEIMRGAKLSLADAVTLAEREVAGRVIEAELDEDDDMYFYRLDVMTDDGLTVLYLNPASGVVVGRRDPGVITGAMNGRDRDRAQALSATPDALVQALRTAEAHTGGKAVEIETERDNGRYRFEVKTIQPGVEHELRIDVQTGEILEVDEDD